MAVHVCEPLLHRSRFYHLVCLVYVAIGSRGSVGGFSPLQVTLVTLDYNSIVVDGVW